MRWFGNQLYERVWRENTIELFCINIIGFIEVDVDIAKNQHLTGEFRENREKISEL